MQDPSCFITSKRAIGVVFMVIDPLAGNNVGMWRGRYQIPCVVCREGRELLDHGCLPVWIVESSLVGFGQWRNDKNRCDVEVKNWFGNAKTNLASSGHDMAICNWWDWHKTRARGRCSWWMSLCCGRKITHGWSGGGADRGRPRSQESSTGFT